MLELYVHVYLRKSLTMKNEIIADKTDLNIDFGNQKLPESSKDTLNHVLNIMDGLVRWLINSGVGYNDFSNSLRRVFYNQSIQELERIDQKKTDSLISLLSGLDRRDVKSFRNEEGQHTILKCSEIEHTISVPARVVGLWIHKKLNPKIPFSNAEISFEKLVKEISTEKHPRSILLELKRLGLVVEEEDSVVLNSKSFTPSHNEKEIKEIFTSNISDHLSVGLKNIANKDDFFLEQAVFVEELSEESIHILKNYSNELWSEMSVKLLAKAMECSKLDEKKENNNKRFKLGIYQFDDVYLNK